MTTAAAVKVAAKIPQACEISFTPRMKWSTRVYPKPAAVGGRPAGVGRPVLGIALFHRKRGVDQFLAVRHFAGESLVGALLRDLEPGVVLLRGQGDDLDI